MSYSINTAVIGSMFGVPTSAVDNYIKLASASQLKTLLWIYRNTAEKIEPEKIASAIGHKTSDVVDALIALCQWGVIKSDENEVEILPQPEPVKADKPEKELDLLPAVKPSNEQVAKRCKEAPEIKNMFKDIEQMLGKSLGYDSQSILIMMHDHYGLPTEVIYMLVDYCNSIGKTGFSYISKVGKDWGEKEIDTIEKADEQIQMLNSCNSIWKEFAKMAGIQNPQPTSSQSAYLRTWTNEMKFNVEMIYLAYEEMLNYSSRISFAYMNKILSNWSAKGLKTPDAVAQDKQAYKESLSKKSDSKKTSYDMNEFQRRADALPVYKKEAE
ncbi:MAG: DnaD domain protein [Ruminococcus sp.]|nr:DnaD domain protein [Candidatus Copronaster equi]